MPGSHPVARAGAGHPQVAIEALRSIAGVAGRNESRRHRVPAATFGQSTSTWPVTRDRMSDQDKPMPRTTPAITRPIHTSVERPATSMTW